MNSLTRSTLRCCNNKNIKICSTYMRYNTSDAAETIIIPPRIKRGPTDILKALASTVTKDYTGPHYKYHDDPYLIPCSNVGRRAFAMSKESGRKAARWVQSEHPDLFLHEVAKPYVQEFAPRKAYDENSVVDENTLKKVIRAVEVNNAIIVYELLEKKGISIGLDTKQSFLELLCFFNCENPVPEELLEERWFAQGVRGRERQRKTWKDNGMAEKIFLSFENKDTAAYSAIIQGMAKYYQVERAWQYYEECRDKNIVLGTETYNSLLRGVNFLRESSELRWKLIQDLLSVMATEKIKPNVGTLNSILESISTMPNQKLSQSYALRTVSEFKKLDIELSLASYYYLLTTFCKDRGPRSDVLTGIMNLIQDQEFTIQDPKDTYFFVTAMDVCRNHLQNKDLGYRVDRLLNTGNNYKFIGDSYKESIYYRHFLMLMCSTEEFDKFIKLYRKLVPHVYIPEPAIMEEIIKAIDVNGAVEYLPQIWTDMVVFDHVERENAISALLTCMVRHEPEKGSDMNASFGNIAWDAFCRIDNFEEGRYRKWRWSGTMLSDVLMLVLRSGNFENACAIMKKLGESHQEIVGLPNVSALQLFIASCIENKDVKKAVSCVQYCADGAFAEVEQMARQVIKELSPKPDVVANLCNIVGKDLQEKEEE